MQVSKSYTSRLEGWYFFPGLHCSWIIPTAVTSLDGHNKKNLLKVGMSQEVEEYQAKGHIAAYQNASSPALLLLL